MRIGIYGGTFNPIHTGHLVVAGLIREKLCLAKVIFVPSCLPPHKSGFKLAPADRRFQMVKEAIKGNRFFTASDYEIGRKGKSYTVDTLRYFRRVYGQKTRLYFIIGADSLLELGRWKQIKAIYKLAKFVVVNRPGYPLRKLPAKSVMVFLPGIEVSSSFIRQRVAQGKTIQYLVPEATAKIIKRYHLYKS